jgi:threonine dehydrogenase-like Zn-dependent dehydrogenase
VKAENIVKADSEDVVEKVRSLAHERGCDLAIECSGADKACGPWLQVLRRFGRGVLCGYHGGRDVTVPIDQISTKELSVYGAWGQAGGFPLAIEILERRAFDFSAMITNRFTMDQLNEVIPQFKDPARITMKAFVTPRALS